MRYLTSDLATKTKSWEELVPGGEREREIRYAQAKNVSLKEGWEEELKEWNSVSME